jgi:hypothetical protein
MMKQHGKHITACLLLLFACTLATAQVNIRATVDRDSILIGEPIALTIEAYMPLGSKVSWFVADSIEHFDITGRSSVDTVQNVDGKKISQVLNITSFDSGRWQMPPFEVIVDGQSFYTDSVGISVGFTPFNRDEDYRDIKDIIEVSNPAVNRIPWILAIIALISLAVLTFYFLRRKKTGFEVHKPVVPLLSPYDEAMKALKSLSKNRTDDAKAHYSALNDILRNYVMRQFHISSFQRTSEELIVQLKQVEMPKDNFISLAQTLRMTDFVKFAKYRPSPEDDKLNYDVITNSIEAMDKKVVSAV